MSEQRYVEVVASQPSKACASFEWIFSSGMLTNARDVRRSVCGEQHPARLPQRDMAGLVPGVSSTRNGPILPPSISVSLTSTGSTLHGSAIVT